MSEADSPGEHEHGKLRPTETSPLAANPGAPWGLGFRGLGFRGLGFRV